MYISVFTCVERDAVVLLWLWSLWNLSQWREWSAGRQQAGPCRASFHSLVYCLKRNVATECKRCTSNPLQFANAKLFGRGWTIAMRCEQLQCDSTTIGSQFLVQCIPSKSHYAVAWGASMQWQCIIIQEKMYKKNKDVRVVGTLRQVTWVKNQIKSAQVENCECSFWWCNIWKCEEFGLGPQGVGLLPSCKPLSKSMQTLCSSTSYFVSLSSASWNHLASFRFRFWSLLVLEPVTCVFYVDIWTSPL